MQELTADALKQGELWSRGARDWETIQEASSAPLWLAALDAGRVGKGTRLLDAGCGAGGACSLAASRGADVFGVDPAVNLITIARERLPAADFRIGELENLLFPNAEFDAAICINALQYTARPELAMHELGRVCRAEGRVVAAVFGNPADSDASRIFEAIVALFPKRPSSAGPFALSAPDALASLVEQVTALRLEAVEEIDCAHSYPDLDTALKGQMSAGASWRAVEILGDDRVRGAVRAALESLRQADGSVRMVNRYRYAIAVKQAG